MLWRILKIHMLPDSQHAKLKIFSKLKLEVSLKERGEGEGGKKRQKYPLKMAKFTHKPMKQAWKECKERCTPGCDLSTDFQRLKEVEEETAL